MTSILRYFPIDILWVFHTSCPTRPAGSHGSEFGLTLTVPQAETPSLVERGIMSLGAAKVLAQCQWQGEDLTCICDYKSHCPMYTYTVQHVKYIHGSTNTFLGER